VGNSADFGGRSFERRQRIEKRGNRHNNRARRREAAERAKCAADCTVYVMPVALPFGLAVGVAVPDERRKQPMARTIVLVPNVPNVVRVLVVKRVGKVESEVNGHQRIENERADAKPRGDRIDLWPTQSHWSFALHRGDHAANAWYKLAPAPGKAKPSLARRLVL
jgi:hypothetical protein